MPAKPPSLTSQYLADQTVADKWIPVAKTLGYRDAQARLFQEHMRAAADTLDRLAQQEHDQRHRAPPAPARDESQARGFSGNHCGSCGSFAMVRTGTCETCQDCGANSGGCS